jgi:hypothetical protein
MPHRGEGNNMKEEEKLKIINEILLRYSGNAAGYDKLQRELWTTTPQQWERILAAYRVDVPEAQQRIAEIQAERQRMAQEQALSNILQLKTGKLQLFRGA